jgi:hypothetical protein
MGQIWKRGSAPAGRQPLPSRTRGPARAQLRDDRSELKWPGGKAGRS